MAYVNIDIDLDDIDLDYILEYVLDKMSQAEMQPLNSRRRKSFQAWFDSISEDEDLLKYVMDGLNKNGKAKPSLYDQQKIDLIPRILEKYNLEQLEQLAQ